MVISRRKIIIAIFLVCILIGGLALQHPYQQHKWTKEVQEAILNNDIERVQHLLDSNPDGDINKRVGSAVSSIFTEGGHERFIETACFISNYKMIDLLLQNGAEVTYESNGWDNLLELTVESYEPDDYEIVTRLIDDGVDITMDTEPMSPLESLAAGSIEMEFPESSEERRGIEENICKTFDLIYRNADQSELEQINSSLDELINDGDNSALKQYWANL